MVPNPTMLCVDPSTTISWEGALCGQMVENISGLRVIWFVIPESIAQLFKEETAYAFLESTKGSSWSEFLKWFSILRGLRKLIHWNQNCLTLIIYSHISSFLVVWVIVSNSKYPKYHYRRSQQTQTIPTVTIQYWNLLISRHAKFYGIKPIQNLNKL